MIKIGNDQQGALTQSFDVHSCQTPGSRAMCHRTFAHSAKKKLQMVMRIAIDIMRKHLIGRREERQKIIEISP